MAMSRFDGCRSFTTSPAMLMVPSEIDFEPGDGVEERGLAAARRPDEDEEAAAVEGEVDPLEDLQAAEALAQAGDLEEGHRRHPFTAPAIRPRTK